jgi:hypothetical protein
MRGLSRHFNAINQSDAVPTKRMEFSARESCVEKQMKTGIDPVSH